MKMPKPQNLILFGIIASGQLLIETGYAAASDSRQNSRTFTVPLPPQIRSPDDRLITRMILRRFSERRSRYVPMMKFFASKHSIPMVLIDTVIRIESAYLASAVGGVGEIGLMQVRPTTASLLGFRGNDIQLSEPKTNIRYGSLYLAQAWRLSKGDLCRTLMKYRAGHGETKMSELSKKYCQRAKRHLAAFGSLSQFSTKSNRKEYDSLQRAAALYIGMPLNYRPGLKIVQRQHPVAFRRGGYLNLRRRVAPAGFMRLR